MPNFKDPWPFLKQLQESGVKVSPERSVDPDKVWNTQTNVVTRKMFKWTGWDPSRSVEENIAQMPPPRGKGDGEDPIIIGNDNYILDGHHRWAYAKLYNELKGLDGQTSLSPVVFVDLNKDQLIAEGKKSPHYVLKTDMDDVLNPHDVPNGMKYVVEEVHKEPVQNAYVDAKNNFILNGKVAGRLIEDGSKDNALNGTTGIVVNQQKPANQASWVSGGRRAFGTANGKMILRISSRELC